MNTSQQVDRDVAELTLLATNAKNDPEILTSLEPLGYTAEKLDEGLVIASAVQQKQQEIQQRYGEKYAASDVLTEKRDAAEVEYRRIAGLAERIFTNDRFAYNTLALDWKKTSPYSVWLSRRLQFFNNSLANDTIKTKLAEHGITEAMLQNGLTLVNAVETARSEREQKRGRAQQATYERNILARDMRSYYRDLKTVSRIALKDKPQYLERLGIVVK